MAETFSDENLPISIWMQRIIHETRPDGTHFNTLAEGQIEVGSQQQEHPINGNFSVACSSENPEQIMDLALSQLVHEQAAKAIGSKSEAVNTLEKHTRKMVLGGIAVGVSGSVALYSAAEAAMSSGENPGYIAKSIVSAIGFLFSYLYTFRPRNDESSTYAIATAEIEEVAINTHNAAKVGALALARRRFRKV